MGVSHGRFFGRTTVFTRPVVGRRGSSAYYATGRTMGRMIEADGQLLDHDRPRPSHDRRTTVARPSTTVARPVVKSPDSSCDAFYYVRQKRIEM